MIYIENNSLNKIFVDVSAATGNTPNYLWNLQNSQGRNVKNFIPRDITATYASQYAGKYKVFEFTTIPTLPENLTPTGTSVVNIYLPNQNQFWLGIYEQSGIGNLNPNNAALVLNSLAFTFMENEEEFYSGNTGNTADNVIYYSDAVPVSPTPTATSSSTPTPTITSTPTETPTSTPTQTPTQTPTLTQTPTGTPTSTPTETPTGTPSQTPTNTPTMTSTETSTPTPTPTITATETSTPTPTPTITPSPTIPAFNIGDGFDNLAQTIFVDSSDNIFVGGNFFGYDETLSSGGLVKLDTTGAINTTFNTGISTTFTGLNNIYQIVEDETGNYIYVVGAWSVVPQRIVKIDKATGLNVWPAQTINGSIFGIAVDGVSGDVYIVGTFTSVNANTRNRIAHFNNAGVLQATFGGVAGFPASPNNIIINRNGNLVVVGAFTTFNGLSANRIIEISTTTYANTGFWGTGTNQQNNMIFQRQDNGQYIIVGNDQTINGTIVGKVAKFTEAGANIPFATGFLGVVPVGFYLDEINNLIYISNAQGLGIRRYDYGTGNTDVAFETNIGSVLPVPQYNASTTRFVINLDSNNKIYWLGSFVFVGGISFNRIIRLNQNGTINTIT